MAKFGNLNQIKTGKIISEREHKGYVLLYSENNCYKNGKEIWKYKCFPSEEEIQKRLQKIIDKVPLISAGTKKFNDEFWYEKNNKNALTYLSFVVQKYIEVIENDSRSPEKIFSEFMQKYYKK